MKIAFFGIEGSYTFFAAKKYFGDEKDFVGGKSFRDVFEEVIRGRCEYGVVPVWNRIAGEVEGIWELVEEFGVKEEVEVEMRIEHCLLGKSGQWSVVSDQLGKIQKVMGHRQAIKQCERFMSEHDWMEAVEWGDNASAVKYVAELDVPDGTSCAAIGSEELGRMYGLEVLRRGIADEEENWTRFLVFRAS